MNVGYACPLLKENIFGDAIYYSVVQYSFLSLIFTCSVSKCVSDEIRWSGDGDFCSKYLPTTDTCSPNCWKSKNRHTSCCRRVIFKAGKYFLLTKWRTNLSKHSVFRKKNPHFSPVWFHSKWIELGSWLLIYIFNKY